MFLPVQYISLNCEIPCPVRRGFVENRDSNITSDWRFRLLAFPDRRHYSISRTSSIRRTSVRPRHSLCAIEGRIQPGHANTKQYGVYVVLAGYCGSVGSRPRCALHNWETWNGDFRRFAQAHATSGLKIVCLHRRPVTPEIHHFHFHFLEW